MSLDTILILAAIAFLYNAFVFCVYWRDKQAARDGNWRVRESTLLLLAFAGGGPGAFSAQKLLRHKTRKPPFPVALPFFLGLQVVIVIVLITTPESFVAIWRSVALH